MRIKSSNPAMRSLGKEMSVASDTPMTVQGTVNKTSILFLLIIFTSTITWKLVGVGSALAKSLMLVGLFGGLIFAVISILSKKNIHITAPIYALFEGLFLGAISAYFNQLFYSGIVLQAVLLTFAVLFVMLLLYKFRILKASPAFVKGVVMATGGIMLFYIVSLVARLFGANISVFSMGIVGSVIQVVIVIVASLNLILDFNFIEQGSANGLPKKMEWYGAFGLMVTLVWLYLEILRLLAVLSRR